MSTLNLDDLKPLDGGTAYIQANWLLPEHVAMIQPESTWENKEAFTGNKYDWYAGYGAIVRPLSIFEVGVFAGYSIAAMLWGAKQVDCEPDGAVLIDIAILRDQIRQLRHVFSGTRIFEFEQDSRTSHTRPHECYDIIHIDGGHDYETAKNDIDKFCPLVSPNGLIIVDDAKDPSVCRPCEDYAIRHNMKTRFIDNYNGHFLMTPGD